MTTEIDPFPPKIPGIKINRSPDRLKAWQGMADVFRSGAKPESFEEAYRLCKPVCGQYENEARAIWDFIRASDTRAIVEVGRNLGGNIFLMCCAARNLDRFFSVDLLEWSLTDEPIHDWLAAHHIAGAVHVADSMIYAHPQAWDRHDWDFVYIDGGHTGEIVSKDISNWCDRTRFIGFHDFADMGRKNCHRKVFQGVVDAIASARDRLGWLQVGQRANSEVIFRTMGGRP